MAQYPLKELAHQFAQDLQAVSSNFEASMSETSSDLLRRVSDSLEAKESPSSESAGKQRLGSWSAGKLRPDVPFGECSPSPLKRAKLDTRSQPAVSPVVDREGSWPQKPTRHLESGTPTPSVAETVQAAPRPHVSKLGGVVAAVSSAATSLLNAASPRQGGSLLDAMRARGTLATGGTGPSPVARPPNAALVPLANVVAAERDRVLREHRSSSESCHEGASEKAAAAPSPASASRAAVIETTRAPKRARENSMVALYKAMVEPQIHIGDPLGAQAATVIPKGKLEMAKKFHRRSSILKQAAALTTAPLLNDSTQKPAVGSGVKPAAPGALSSTSPGRPGMAAPEKVASKITTSAVAAGLEPSPNGKRLVKKTPRPPVPLFSSPVAVKLEPWQLLRQAPPLSPKKDEDNYEMSEKDENSDDGGEEPDRSNKHVPRWVDTYLETLATQSNWDPDSIFGNKVPCCDLDSIFSIETYKKYNRERPVRKRGSSGMWKKDRLQKVEIREYKKKMGQIKPWNAPSKTTQLPADAAH